MGSPNLAVLQATTNRFAAFAGFTPISADGGMGPLTVSAVTKALTFVGDFGLGNAVIMAATGNGAPSDSSRQSANGFLQVLRGMDPATAIMQNNQDINFTLMTAANEMGLKASASGGGGGGGIFVSTNTGNAQLPTPTAASQGFIADLALKLGMSTAQVVLFLAMSGGVAFLAYKRASGKKGRR